MADDNKYNKENTQRKVGVYVCHCGGNISDHVAVEEVCKNAEKIPGVVKVQNDVFMCSDPGQELIMEDIRKGTVDRVVVASCAPDLHESTFRNAISRAGGNPYIYEHANIREQVSWVHHGDQATLKATRLVAAAAAKARELQPLEPFRVEAKKACHRHRRRYCGPEKRPGSGKQRHCGDAGREIPVSGGVDRQMGPGLSNG